MIEIIAWNILVMCAAIYLAQGGGIILFFFSRRPMPVIVRLLCGVLFICVLFSPGLNVLAVILLILLGVAENWVPFRTEKQANNR